MVFIKHIDNLTMLTLQNFQIMFDAIQEYGAGTAIYDLETRDIDASHRQGDFPARQKALIAQEEIIKTEIRQIITQPEVVGKPGFYIFFFDQIAKVRRKTIDKLLNSMIASAE
jgi:hypothetical protein